MKKKPEPEIFSLTGKKFKILLTMKLLLVFIMLTVLNVSAVLIDEQEFTVTGKVTEAATGEPLPGVAVTIRGTTIGTTTDVDGTYSIQVPQGVTLRFSFVGMRTQEILVDGRTTIDVEMDAELIGLEEVVAVGYGTQKRVNLTGAVATVSSEELRKISTVNTTQLLQGQMAGVLTKQSSGMPGVDHASISIRGYGSPLILIDGTERSLSSIDPEMIESISVLKDASAAIYGARAGNGVILVTTKRGAYQEDMRITYHGNFTSQQFTHKPGTIKNAGLYAEFLKEAQLASGMTPTYSDEEIEKYYSGEPGYESYDWYDYAFRNWTPRQSHNISARGGGENVSFFVNLGATDQQSVITSDDWWYKRYNIRSNIDGRLSDNLSFALDLNYIHEHRSFAGTGDDMWRGVYKSEPMAPTSFPEPYSDLPPASNTRGTHQRLVGEMNKDVQGGADNMPKTFNGEFSVNYNFPFLQGLSANAGFNYHMVNRSRKEIMMQWIVYKQNPETGEVVPDGRFPAHIVNNMLRWDQALFTRLRPKIEIRYDRNYGNHTINGLVVGEYFETNSNWFRAETENLISNELFYLPYGDRTYHNLYQNVWEGSRASIAGRVNYGYLGKYLMEGTFRYDASSFFPPDNRWGFFPSFSAAWRISEESFMEDVNWLDNLKLRASYSETGYDANAIRYDYFAGYNIHSSPLYLFGSEAYQRIQIGTLPNFGMTWEKMTNYNVGLDVNMWNGLLNGIFEVFYRKRSDILATPQRSFPSTFGGAISRYNLNSQDNRGVELELSHLNRIGDFLYSIKGNVTYARSKWIHYEESDYSDEDDIRILQQSGNWTNRAIGYVSDGIFRSQEEIDNHPIDQDQAGNTTLVPGDIKYKDINDDGIISWADQQRIGYGTGLPELNFGLGLGGAYKGFSIDILLHGGSMFSGNISGFARTPFDNESTPLTIHWKERFHEENNPDGTLPSASYGTRSNNMKYSDFWLKSVTFLRLKNVNLSYSFPKQWFQTYGIEGIEAYLSANNLAVISNLGIWSSEFDPEAPFGHSGYPPHRTISFGINVML